MNLHQHNRNFRIIGLIIILSYNKVVGGYIGFTLSVCLSLYPAVRPAYCVRSVTSTVLDGFFPYEEQITIAWVAVSCIMTFDLTYIFKVIQQQLCNKTAKICHIMSALQHLRSGILLIGQKSRSHRSLEFWWLVERGSVGGYPSRSPICNF